MEVLHCSLEVRGDVEFVKEAVEEIGTEDFVVEWNRLEPTDWCVYSLPLLEAFLVAVAPHVEGEIELGDHYENYYVLYSVQNGRVTRRTGKRITTDGTSLKLPKKSLEAMFLKGRYENKRYSVIKAGSLYVVLDKAKGKAKVYYGRELLECVVSVLDGDETPSWWGREVRELDEEEKRELLSAATELGKDLVIDLLVFLL